MLLCFIGLSLSLSTSHPPLCCISLSAVFLPVFFSVVPLYHKLFVVGCWRVSERRTNVCLGVRVSSWHYKHRNTVSEEASYWRRKRTSHRSVCVCEGECECESAHTFRGAALSELPSAYRTRTRTRMHINTYRYIPPSPMPVRAQLEQKKRRRKKKEEEREHSRTELELNTHK